MFAKLRSVCRKNRARFRARSAIRRGLFQGIDWEAMTALRKEFDGNPMIEKYFDRRDHGFVRNAARIFQLGLERSAPLRILDIGCGFGFFMYAVKRFGHQPVGLDVDDAYLKRVTDLLALEKVIHRIEPYQPLPDIPGGPFDLITAFATCFDCAGKEGQWGPEQWEYFMRDLSRSMAPGCRVYLKFNQYVGEGATTGMFCRPVPTALWDYFRSNGGTFDKRAMDIPDAASHCGISQNRGVRLRIAPPLQER